MSADVASIDWYAEDSVPPLTVSKPAGFASTQVLLVAISSHGGALSDLTTPSGWTQQGTWSTGTGSTEIQGKLFSYVFTGSDPSTWDFGYNGGADIAACCIRTTGADTTPVVVVASTNFASSTASMNSPSVNPSGSTDLLLALLANVCGGTALVETDPSGMTDRSQGQVSGNFMAMAAASQQLASSSATGTRTWTSASPTGTVAATVSIAVKSAAAAAATYPPQRQAARRAVPATIRRPRPAPPVRAQLNPPYPTQEIDQARRIRGLLPRRARLATPVPKQVNPPYPVAEIDQPRRLRGWLIRRGRQLAPPVPMQAAPVDPVDQPRRLRGLLPRRGRQVTVVPPQFNPPFPFAELAQPRRIRGLLARRGRQASPVQAQVTFVNPAFPWSAITAPKRSRGMLSRRGRAVSPVPPQLNPRYPFAEVVQPRRVRGLLARRAKLAQPVPAQQTAPQNPAFVPDRSHGRVRLLRARGRAVRAPIEQSPVLQRSTVRRALIGRLRRILPFLPLGQATPPPFVPIHNGTSDPTVTGRDTSSQAVGTRRTSTPGVAGRATSSPNVSDG